MRLHAVAHRKLVESEGFNRYWRLWESDEQKRLIRSAGRFA